MAGLSNPVSRQTRFIVVNIDDCSGIIQCEWTLSDLANAKNIANANNIANTRCEWDFRQCTYKCLMTLRFVSNCILFDSFIKIMSWLFNLTQLTSYQINTSGTQYV